MSDEHKPKPGDDPAQSGTAPVWSSVEGPAPDLTSDPQTADPLEEAAAFPSEGVTEDPDRDPAPDLTGDPLTDDPLTGDPLTGDPLTGDPPIDQTLTEDPLTEPSVKPTPWQGAITPPVESIAAAAAGAAVGGAKPEPTTPEAAPHPMPVTPIARKGGGFLGPLAGGILAAGLGAGAAWYVLTQMMPAPVTDPEVTTLNTRLNDQAGEISRLRADVTRLAAAPVADPQAAADEIMGLRSALEAAAVREGDLAARVAAIEARPAPAAGTVQLPPDLADEIRGQSERNAALATAFDDLQRTTAERLDSAATEARRAAADAVAARISLAVLDGGSFGPLLEQARGLGLTPPEALAAYADGVADEAALTEGFPDAARRALDAANLAGVDGAGIAARTGVFLRNQLGVRSLAPREGSGPDAVLSRMQAAVDAGRFDQAIAEAEALPPEGQAAMAGWLESARTRMAAVDAVTALQAQIGQ